MKLEGITRRDFVGGFSLGVGALAAGLSPLEAVARGLLPPQAIGDYPPARTGLRGSHPGSFEVAHAVFREGKRWPHPEERIDATYDLVVVGAGFGGLAAAWFFRQQAGPDAKILLLDNHDDFGGHAKRNEFDVDGKTLVGSGGSSYMVSPEAWSPELKSLLREIDVDVRRFESEFLDADFRKRHGLSAGIFFDAARYGADSIQPDALGRLSREGVERAVANYPISELAKAKLVELVTTKREVYPGVTLEEKRKRLKQTSYEEYLRNEFAMPDEVLDLIRNLHVGLGHGADAATAMHASFWEAPGLRDVDPRVWGPDNYVGRLEAGINHFPDGNATLARLMVRKLVPGSVPGKTLEDSMTARVAYDRLDRDENAVRIRLESTAIDVRQAEGGKSVDVTYIKDGTAYRVRGKHAVVACWGNVIPHICPELGDVQKKALNYPEKWPLNVINVALRDWKAIAKSGFDSVRAPNGFFSSVGTGTPISVGSYRFSRSPNEPIVLGMYHVPVVFVRRGTSRERIKAGRHALLAMSYDDFEKKIVDQLQAIWGPYGFDAEQQIAAISVNRWPHGVTYFYDSLFDPFDWSVENGPHIQAQRRMGRISFAGADVGNEPLAHRALQEGLRAAREQLALG